LEEYNKQFYNTVDMGIFRKLSVKEMAEYKGPVNLITTVETFKNWPHATMPLQI